MTSRCWANVLGGCDKISHEHVVSRGVLKGKCDCPIISDGKNSAPNGTFGVDRMTSKILCRTHNLALSEVDAEAKRLQDYVAEAKAPGREGDLTLDGFLIERWALKTGINYFAAGWGDSKKWRPDKYVVECAFGLHNLPNGYGIYSVDSTDQDIEPREFSLTPIFSINPAGNRPLSGYLIRLSGLSILFALQPNLVEVLNLFPVPLAVGRSSDLHYVYRPGAFAIEHQDGSTRRIKLNWPGRKV